MPRTKFACIARPACPARITKQTAPWHGLACLLPIFLVCMVEYAGYPLKTNVLMGGTDEENSRIVDFGMPAQPEEEDASP